MHQPSINQFNKLVPIYDWMAKIFIGEVIRDAQRYFLRELSEAKTILILGGGTGWILEDINSVNAKAEILYVEASSSMIGRAKLVVVSNKVTFIHGTEADLKGYSTFDAVITNFYFDLFSEVSLPEKIKLIKSHLTIDAKWFVTDFVKSKKVGHRILLWIMYRFFRWTTNIESKRIPSWQEQMKTEGMKELKGQHFKSNFIRSVVYKV